MNTLLSSIIFVALCQIPYSYARGKRIDIFSQNGGDVVQLRSQTRGKDVMYNALPRNSDLKWTMYRDSNNNFVIPYIITGLYDNYEKKIISEAMSRLENNTCLRFKKRGNERDYINIKNERYEGCYTNVGRMPGSNVVMLESNDAATCIETDIVMHELMHSIGLWHEHMRYDRDDFISVIYENIEPSYASQFEKISKSESTTYDVPYDYTSVMHYAETAFAKRGKISMKTKNPIYQKVIGHQRDASPSDYRKICLLYGCDKCMGKDFDGQTDLVRVTDTDQPDFSGLPPVTMPPNSHSEEDKECTDVFPNFCPTLVQRGIFRCDIITGRTCCASCGLQRSTSSSNKSNGGIFQSIFNMFG